MAKTKVLIGLVALLLMATIVHGGILDDLNTSLTAEDKAALAETMSPIGILIGILQYAAGAVFVLGIIGAGFTYYKGDPASKQATLSKISAVIIAAILVFGATTIARILGIGG